MPNKTMDSNVQSSHPGKKFHLKRIDSATGSNCNKCLKPYVSCNLLSEKMRPKLIQRRAEYSILHQEPEECQRSVTEKR